MNFSLNHLSDKFIFWNLKKISYGYLELIDSRGNLHCFGKSTSPLKVKLKIINPSFSLKLIKKGSIGLADSYINNDFQTDNLSSLIELSARNINVTYKFSGFLELFSFSNFLNKKKYSNTKAGSKKNISLHYDLGNEFFSTWLDKTLTYSCGIFSSANETLEKAQINKYNKLINLIKPKNGDKILEIGCGWGGFAEHLAKNYNIKLDCITISQKQFLFTKERIRKAKLNDKVNVRLLDYREIKNKYDCIVSIEMIEAVGEKYLNQYFNIIKSNLAKGGRIAIQSIVIKDELYNRYKSKQDFIQKYIFPGGFLPSLKSLNKVSNQSGLKIDSYQLYGEHYSNTLQKWRESFLYSWDNISKQGFNLNFKRTWDFYFSYCDAAINKEVKAVWIIGEDVVQTDPNSAHVAKAMNSLDLLVVQEIFMSETAKHADVILPGTTFLEKDGTFTNTERRVQRVNRAVEPLPGTKPDGVIVTEMMQKLGYNQPVYDADEVLAEIADVVPFFKGITRERLGKLGLQWPVKEDGTDTKILHQKEFKIGKGRLKYFDWKESTEIEENKKDYPLILTTSRVLAHYNASTMTKRTKNIKIVDEDILLLHPNDAKIRELNTGDIGRLYSGRGEVSLKVEVTDRVKEGVVFTTFHFPEHMVNMVTGHGKDEETMCAEYKVSSVEVQKISNQFKTKVSTEKDQAEVIPA